MTKLFQNPKVKVATAAWWSNLQSKLKIHQIFFILLCFCLPFQLNKFFWPNFSFINGLRVDYLAPSLYLSDIFVFLTLLSWFPQAVKKIKLNTSLFFALLAFVIFNIFLATSPWLAFIRWLKILEFIFLGLYVSFEAHLEKTTKALIAGVFVQLVIAFGQFLTGGSLGLWFLGERIISIGKPGIALGNIFGHQFLRPYATFGHPNAFAGFLLVLLTLSLSIKKSILIRMYQIFGLLSLLVLASRTIFVTIFLLPFFYLLRKDKYKFYFLVSLIILGTFTSFTSFLTESAFLERQQLAIASLKIWLDSPILGVGLNNFLINLSENFNKIYIIQPVHNIFLLILSETGIFGLGFFLLFVYKSLNKRNLVIYMAMVVIILTGLFDHYWLTLQANGLLLAIIIGLVWANNSKFGKLSKEAVE